MGSPGYANCEQAYAAEHRRGVEQDLAAEYASASTPSRTAEVTEETSVLRGIVVFASASVAHTESEHLAEHFLRDSIREQALHTSMTSSMEALQEASFRWSEEVRAASTWVRQQEPLTEDFSSENSHFQSLWRELEPPGRADLLATFRRDSVQSPPSEPDPDPTLEAHIRLGHLMAELETEQSEACASEAMAQAHLEEIVQDTLEAISAESGRPFPGMAMLRTVGDLASFLDPWRLGFLAADEEEHSLRQARHEEALLQDGWYQFSPEAHGQRTWLEQYRLRQDRSGRLADTDTASIVQSTVGLRHDWCVSCVSRMGREVRT